MGTFGCHLITFWLAMLQILACPCCCTRPCPNLKIPDLADFKFLRSYFNYKVLSHSWLNLLSAQNVNWVFVCSLLSDEWSASISEHMALVVRETNHLSLTMRCQFWSTLLNKKWNGIKFKPSTDEAGWESDQEGYVLARLRGSQNLPRFFFPGRI